MLCADNRQPGRIRALVADSIFEGRQGGAVLGLPVLIWICICVSGFAVAADSAPDYAREDRIAEQISAEIFDGQAVWLKADAREFLAIHIAVDDASDAVILMHGRDTSAQEQEVIGPARVALAEMGWSTLSIQLPVLPRGNTYYDYLPILHYAHPRIEAAISFLRQRGAGRVFILAHSCGAHMANSWLNAQGDDQIDGYMALGLGATDAGQDLKTLLPIGNMQVPVLDLYGSEEFDRPLAMVAERQRLLVQNGHPASMQKSIDGANHYFSGYGDSVVATVSTWLSQLE